jgi:hypothetical protein
VRAYVLEDLAHFFLDFRKLLILDLNLPEIDIILVDLSGENPGAELDLEVKAHLREGLGFAVVVLLALPAPRILALH